VTQPPTNPLPLDYQSFSPANSKDRKLAGRSSIILGGFLAFIGSCLGLGLVAEAASVSSGSGSAPATLKIVMGVICVLGIWVIGTIFIWGGIALRRGGRRSPVVVLVAACVMELLSVFYLCTAIAFTFFGSKPMNANVLVLVFSVLLVAGVGQLIWLLIKILREPQVS